jgi:hypothetical protein
MINVFFSNPYYSTGIAIILSLTLAFVHIIDIYHSKVTLLTLMMLSVIMMMSISDDYALVLLVVALVIVVYTLSLQRRQKENE